MSEEANDYFDGLYRYEAQLRREDWAAFVRLPGHEWWRSTRVPQVIALLAGMGWGLVEWGKELLGHIEGVPFAAGWRPAVIVGAVIIAVAIVFTAGSLAARLAERRRINRWHVPRTRTRVDIFGDHVAVREEGKERHYAWGQFKSLVLGSDHVFLVASNDDVIILPLVVFDDRNDMLGFYGYYSNHTLMDIANGDINAPMTLHATFSLTAEDSRAVSRALANVTLLPLWQAAAVTGILGGILTSGLYGWWVDGPFDWMAWLATAWPGSVLLTVLGAWRLEAIRDRPWPTYDPRGDKRDILLEEEGFKVAGKDFETRVGWGSITEITETADHIVIITQWHDVYGVPKRCFPDNAAVTAFVSSARGWQAAFLNTWKRDARAAAARRGPFGDFFAR